MESKKKFMIARDDGWGYVCGWDSGNMPKWSTSKSLAIKMTEKQWCKTDIGNKLKHTPFHIEY